MKRWRCRFCHEIIQEDSLLKANSPFNSDEELVGCPQCKSCVEGFDEVCDEPGCLATASCGFPSPDGYRRTCFVHSEFNVTRDHRDAKC